MTTPTFDLDSGHTLQESIAFALRQRNLARDKGFNDVAAFWESELHDLRGRVPALPLPSQHPTEWR